MSQDRNDSTSAMERGRLSALSPRRALNALTLVSAGVGIGLVIQIGLGIGFSTVSRDRLEQEIRQRTAIRLVEEQEEIGWEQLRELWEEVSDHASVEEDMKRWLETRFDELAARSESACRHEQTPQIQTAQSSAKSAVELATKALGNASVNVPLKRLLTSEAHKSLLAWDEALMVLCPR